jgi:hypothetical protein
MAEVSPQITLAPDGTLSINPVDRVVDNSAAANELLELAIEGLIGRGWERAENGSTLRANIIATPQAIGLLPGTVAEDDVSVKNTVEDIAYLTVRQRTNNKDSVLAVHGLFGNRQLEGTTFRQFQQWLEDDGFNEQVAHRCVLGMASAYPHLMLTTLSTYRFNGHSGYSRHFDIGVGEGPLNIRVQDSERISNMGLRWLIMRSGNDKSNTSWRPTTESLLGNHVVSSESLTLYDMTSSGLEKTQYRRRLSLLLGIGVLAHEAAQYQGQEWKFQPEK